MPSAFLFVLPGAMVAAYMRTVCARPLMGAVLFALIVVVVPALLWPAGLTGDFSGLSRRLRPRGHSPECRTFLGRLAGGVETCAVDR
ncbi:MAG TPA: hypothetical protein VH228_14515 [Nocardioides sp.]|jgi:hypothetical protein|nr:hypothetical protein [Nocardioides sp.]